MNKFVKKNLTKLLEDDNAIVNANELKEEKLVQ